MKRYRVDLHTHSKLSPDGSIEEKDYKQVLQMNRLDVIAITDHNTIEYAVHCQRTLGEQIIVGEEISTRQGHLIGLFLKKNIESGKDVLESAQAIKSQGGLVYVPHAFDFLRSGIGEKQLIRIREHIDILEVFNGRVIFPLFNIQAKKFAQEHRLLGAFGSDSHIADSLGKGFMAMTSMPSDKIGVYHDIIIQESYNSFFGYFAPKYNRLQKLLNK